MLAGNITSEGSVGASSLFPGYSIEAGVDSRTNSNWYSDGLGGREGSAGPNSEEYSWEHPSYLRFSRVEMDPESMGGFGFETVRLTVSQRDGTTAYVSEPISLPGFDASIGHTIPGEVIGSRLAFLFLNHENPNCGGFSELRVFAERAPDVVLHEFRSGASNDLIELDYSILDIGADTDLDKPLSVRFFAATDGPSGGAERALGSRLQIDESAFGEDGLFRELKGEPASAALQAGRHTIVMDPSGTFLEAALEDPAVEILMARLDPDDQIIDEPENDLAVFRGAYQGEPNRRAVIRSGANSVDQVLLTPGVGMSMVAGSHRESTQFDSPQDVLIVTGALDDVVQTQSADSFLTPLLVKAGEGFDRVFAGAGDDRLFAGTDVVPGATTDFNLLVGGLGNDTLQGGSAKDILLGDSVDAELSSIEQIASDLARNRFRFNAALEPVGSGDDALYGGDNIDVLIGGGGDDLLDGNGGLMNFLLGDFFRFQTAVDVDFAPLLDADLSDPREAAFRLVGVAESLARELSFAGVDSGDDDLRGAGTVDIAIAGDGDDLIRTTGNISVILAGAGDDTLDALQNNFAIGFAGPGQDLVKSPRGPAAVGSVMWGDNLLVDPNCSLACADLMEGGDGVDILIGGEGDDSLDGGDDSDVLLGDSYTLGLPEFKSLTINLSKLQFKADFRVAAAGNGKDTLRGGDNESSMFPDVLIGGPNDDLLIGGPGGGLLFGDTPEATTAGEAIDFSKVKNQETPAATKRATSRLFEIITRFFKLSGNGNDTIHGGTGLDLIVAGDGDDVVKTGGGLADIVFGNEGDDTIHGDQTFFNLIVGGEGNDWMRGATSGELTASFLFGDTFDFSKLAPGLGLQIDLETPKLVFSAGTGGLLATGSGNDTLIAEHGFNFEMGGNGDDVLVGKGLFNVMMGDSINLGADAKFTFSGNPEDDFYTHKFRLPGLDGDGADHIFGGNDANVIIAGGGNDRVFGGNGPLEIIFGNGGNDVIHGAQGFNALVGGDDDDQLYGGHDMNILIGDSFVFGAGVPGIPDLAALRSLRFVSGRGFLPDGSGHDLLQGGAGVNLLVGGDGIDNLRGGNGVNVMFGDAISLGGGLSVDLRTLLGNPGQAFEILRPLELSGNGFDTISGGNSFDLILGGGGNDSIRGGAGIDVLFGHGDDDLLQGGPGFDVLFGGDQEDCLDGGGGIDIHRGGSQADRFVFTRPRWERLASDFDLATGDRLVASCSEEAGAAGEAVPAPRGRIDANSDSPPKLKLEVDAAYDNVTQLWNYQYILSGPVADDTDHRLLAFSLDVGTAASLQQVRTPSAWQAAYQQGDHQIEWSARSDDAAMPADAQLRFGFASGLPPVPTTAGFLTLNSAVGYAGGDLTVETVEGPYSAFASESRPPIAAADLATTNLSLSVAIDVIANDDDGVEINPTTVVVDRPAENGTVVVDPVSGQMTYTPDAGFFGTDEYYYRVQNAAGLVSKPAKVSVAVKVWQNARRPEDVNGDGLVAPNDVLRLINDINANGARRLPPSPPEVAPPPAYLDTDGDGSVAPFDVLLVINFLNDLTHAEGEAPSVDSAQADDREMGSAVRVVRNSAGLDRNVVGGQAAVHFVSAVTEESDSPGACSVMNLGFVRKTAKPVMPFPTVNFDTPLRLAKDRPGTLQLVSTLPKYVWVDAFVGDEEQ